MIRIQRVFSTALSIDQHRIAQVEAIFRENFKDVSGYPESIPEKVSRPFTFGYLSILLVSESATGKVTGFSLFNHFPEIESSLLDFIAVRRNIRGSGIGSALYEATREYLNSIGSKGLFMEVHSDEPIVISQPAMLTENRKRMAFYEAYGVFPVVNTDYEKPFDDSPAPLLLFDSLGRKTPLRKSEARVAVRLILKRKYSHLVGEEYIERVVASFKDDPVRFRPPRYSAKPSVGAAISPPTPGTGRMEKPFLLVYSTSHRIHHVRERGYVERPARVRALVESISRLGLFETVEPRHFGEDPIREVHDGDFVTYLRNVCRNLSGDRAVYPYVFPIRRPERKPKELALRAGYFCIDTFTPLDRNAYSAARSSVDVVLTAAEELLKRGPRLAFGLCRPPGHHAETRSFGGFCYFNNAAIAAQRLAKLGRVVLIDLDFHHGNGGQEIFYRRDDVLTLSIHGHPNYAYPYFSGFADERGEGPGRGFNLNYPLPENTGPEVYFQTLDKALREIRRFDPTVLVVSLGFDTMKGDPTGAFLLTADSLKQMGRRLAELNRPTLIVQEGGYSLRNLRRGAVSFFSGFSEALSSRPVHSKAPGNGRS